MSTSDRTNTTKSDLDFSDNQSQNKTLSRSKTISSDDTDIPFRQDSGLTMSLSSEEEGGDQII